MAEAVMFCAMSREKFLYGLGDINARIASKKPTTSPLSRISMDETANARGTWFLDLCDDAGVSILNGSSLDVDGTAQFTSFQPMGKSVIDYAFVSNG
ncbi:hypothetical protein C8R43DRAFT_906216, partial [Mycena crocata]